MRSIYHILGLILLNVGTGFGRIICDKEANCFFPAGETKNRIIHDVKGSIIRLIICAWFFPIFII